MTVNEYLTTQCGFLWWFVLILLCFENRLVGGFVNQACFEATVGVTRVGVADAYTEVIVAFWIFVRDVIVAFGRGAVPLTRLRAFGVESQADGVLTHEGFAIEYLENAFGFFDDDFGFFEFADALLIDFGNLVRVTRLFCGGGRGGAGE